MALAARARWPTVEDVLPRLLSRTGTAVVAIGLAALLAGCGQETGSLSAAGSPPRAAAASPAAPAGSVAGRAPTGDGPALSAPPVAAGYRFYLSVGDSLAFGYQQGRLQALQASGRYRAAAFDTGYPNLVAAAVRRRAPGLVTENLGCPGETTTSFRTGPCPFLAALPGVVQPLHTPYLGAQETAAVAFLRGEHSAPGLVTVSLGANDIGAVLRACHGVQLTCIRGRFPGALRTVRTDLADTLQSLHRADAAATLVVVAPYNPYAAVSTLSDPLVVQLDGAIRVAAQIGHARVADAFTSFNASPGEQDRLCQLTAICTPGHDIHPSNAGYRLLAAIVLRALG